MSRWRESSGASLGSQITPPAVSSSGKLWASMVKRRKSLERGLAAHVALAHEGRAVDAAEDHVVAADVHVVGGVARLDVELAGGLGHLGHDEVRVELDGLAVDALAGGPEELDRLGLDELDADL